MTSPLAGSRPRHLELQRATSFKTEPDKGENLEVAMLGTVFKKLQDAGLIPAGALMNGKLAKLPGMESLSYEGRLRELIRDSNGNGQLDLDLSRLAAADMLVGTPTVEDLDAVLSGRTVVGLPDAFLQKQNTRSNLATSSGLTSKGAAAQGYSRGMVLTTEQDRTTAAFVAEAGPRALKSPAEARIVADEAINGAAVLTGKGDGRRARALLDKTGQALAEAGRLGEAKDVFTELARPPHAGVKRNLIQDEVDGMKAQVPTFNEGYQGVEKPFGLNVVSLMPKEFVSTVGQMAQVRLAQLEVQTRMEATLGRQVDPRNVDDATAFFDAFAKDKPLAPVAEQYESYLKAFYKHSGADVGWTDTIPADQRGARVGELFDRLPRDEAGRTLVDCEGFSYLTAHILGGVKDETGKPRLDVLYATRPDHVITGVLDQGTKQAFTVNNDAVSAPTAVGNALEVQRLIGQALAGSNANIIGIATTQSESWPQVNHDKHQPPQLGALVWDGKKVVGQITAQSQAAFIQFSRDNGTESYSAFVKWSLKQ